MKQDFLDEIAKVKNPYSALVQQYYGTFGPFWDETAAGIMLDPSIVTNSTSFYLDVDTTPSSPSYGNIHAYQKALMPAAQKLRKVNMPISIDSGRLKSMIKHSVQFPKSCEDLDY